MAVALIFRREQLEGSVGVSPETTSTTMPFRAGEGGILTLLLLLTGAGETTGTGDTRAPGVHLFPEARHRRLEGNGSFLFAETFPTLSPEPPEDVFGVVETVRLKIRLEQSGGKRGLLPEEAPPTFFLELVV